MKSNPTKQAIIVPLNQNHRGVSNCVLDTVINCHLSKQLNNVAISLPVIIDGKIGTVGFKFMLKLLDSNISIFYEFVEVISTDYFTRLKVHAYKTIPKTFDFYLVIDILNNETNKSIIYSSFIYNDNIMISDFLTKQEMLKREILFKNIEIYMGNNEHKKFFYTGVNININLDLVWKMLLNMKTIQKYAKIISKEIKYNENILQKGTEVELVYHNNNYINGKILKCMKTDDYGIIKIISNGKYIVNRNGENFPLSAIKISINEFENKITIFIFFSFSITQTLNKLIYFRKYFQKELEKFKEISEHYNTNNYKNVLGK